MSQFEFYTEVGITKPYFYDMLSGRTNPPPRETLDRMMDVLEKHLKSDEKRRTEFIDHAARCRGEIPCDISKMILEHPECWESLRTTLQSMLTTKG